MHMLIESLESRQLFAVNLPAAKVVLPLTPAADQAQAPTVTVPDAAIDAASAHVGDALDHIPDLG
jgi:hypothetical protein